MHLIAVVPDTMNETHMETDENLQKKGNYSKARQKLQDKIVRKMLDGATITDETNGCVCTTPTEPWIVFTAGVMVSFPFNPFGLVGLWRAVGMCDSVAAWVLVFKVFLWPP